MVVQRCCLGRNAIRSVWGTTIEEAIRTLRSLANTKQLSSGFGRCGRPPVPSKRAERRVILQSRNRYSLLTKKAFNCFVVTKQYCCVGITAIGITAIC